MPALPGASVELEAPASLDDVLVPENVVLNALADIVDEGNTGTERELGPPDEVDGATELEADEALAGVEDEDVDCCAFADLLEG